MKKVQPKKMSRRDVARAKALREAEMPQKCEGDRNVAEAASPKPDLEIDVILDAVRFHRKEDRVKLRQQFGMLVSRRSSRAMREMYNKISGEQDLLRTRIRRLECELRRESSRHAADLIEAHEAPAGFGGAQEVALAG